MAAVMPAKVEWVKQAVAGFTPESNEVGLADGSSLSYGALVVSPGLALNWAGVAGLPLHHTDPFDRLLLAQAFCEPLRLITADRTLAAYGGAVEVI
jgi:hypothetical protein